MPVRASANDSSVNEKLAAATAAGAIAIALGGADVARADAYADYLAA